MIRTGPTPPRETICIAAVWIPCCGCLLPSPGFFRQSLTLVTHRRAQIPIVVSLCLLTVDAVHLVVSDLVFLFYRSDAHIPVHSVTGRGNAPSLHCHHALCDKLESSSRCVCRFFIPFSLSLCVPLKTAATNRTNRPAPNHRWEAGRPVVSYVLCPDLQTLFFEPFFSWSPAPSPIIPSFRRSQCLVSPTVLRRGIFLSPVRAHTPRPSTPPNIAHDSIPTLLAQASVAAGNSGAPGSTPPRPPGRPRTCSATPPAPVAAANPRTARSRTVLRVPRLRPGARPNKCRRSAAATCSTRCSAAAPRWTRRLRWTC